MLNNKTISIVIPAYNEERSIISVLKSIPSFVDKIIVVNDGSFDLTKKNIEDFINTQVSINQNYFDDSLQTEIENNYYKERENDNISIYYKYNIFDRCVLINHHKNLKKGAAIISGYMLSKNLNIDCTVTIDGDGQMNINEIELLCLPIINKEIDYVKGNRFKHPQVWKRMPKIRILGNLILTFLTRLASGYYNLSDTQTGFNAISIHALKKINLNNIYKDFGYPNDLLCSLNVNNCIIKQVKIEPIYHNDRISKMNLVTVIPRILLLLIESYYMRCYKKYLIKNVQPIATYFIILNMLWGLLFVALICRFSFNITLTIFICSIILFYITLKEDKKLNSDLEL